MSNEDVEYRCLFILHLKRTFIFETGKRKRLYGRMELQCDDLFVKHTAQIHLEIVNSLSLSL